MSRREAEVLVRSFVGAWNAHDAELITAHWWDDGDVVNPFGRRADGKEEIEVMMREEHQQQMASSILTATIESYREVAADVMVIDTRGLLDGVRAPNGGKFTLHHRLFIVAWREDGKWAFASVRASVTPM